ncbi:hypothetical protein M218_07795 [Burkholderia pseudomallei MSHR338]|nr:hypothetical protein M218_07795 [Burkholderia pseudomallei MSHR338]
MHREPASRQRGGAWLARAIRRVGEARVRKHRVFL